MRERYDFARMKGRRNPYASRLKRSVTIRLDDASITYFKELAAETGIPYQSLMNLYLRDCVARRLRLAQRWESGDERQAVQTDSELRAAEFTASDRPARPARRHATRK
jgi:hypothetical protein